jgi:hypothetical protein
MQGFERHMTAQQMQDAERDYGYLRKLMDLGLVGFVKGFFSGTVRGAAHDNGKIYNDFRRDRCSSSPTS